MTTLETLKAARKQIELPENWIKNSLARDETGADVDPWMPEACEWCMAGSVLAVCGGWNSEYDSAIETLQSVLPCRIVSSFNDSRKHADVLRAFDEAIKKLESA